MLLPLSLFLSLAAFVASAPRPQAATTAAAAAGTTTASTSATSSSPTLSVVPFFSISDTFTPTATGDSQVPGAVVTIINSAGAGSYTDTFVYTAASVTVSPTGNVTISATGAAASASNLEPDPKNLQTAAARRMVDSGFVGSSVAVYGVVLGSVLLGAVGGVGLVW